MPHLSTLPNPFPWLPPVRGFGFIDWQIRTIAPAGEPPGYSGTIFRCGQCLIRLTGLS